MRIYVYVYTCIYLYRLPGISRLRGLDLELGSGRSVVGRLRVKGHRKGIEITSLRLQGDPNEGLLWACIPPFMSSLGLF